MESPAGFVSTAPAGLSGLSSRAEFASIPAWPTGSLRCYLDHIPDPFKPIYAEGSRNAEGDCI
jgi:hypothetical protein